VNYYNEWEPFAGEWLKELIKDGLIPDGTVDNRSIADVEPSDLKGFTQCHFFAGIGGWSRALELAGWEPGRAVWTGSPPCQPFSAAGNHSGKDDDRHLWPVFFNLISKCHPPTIFGEQVASAIRFGWLDDVQRDLEAENYAAAAVVLPSGAVHAPHKRERLFFVADSLGQGLQGHGQSGQEPVPQEWQREARHRTQSSFWDSSTTIHCRDGKHRPVPTEPSLFPLVNGLSNRVGILRGTGNAIVPQAAAEIIKAYMETYIKLE
jgi:DNA (cytosine-5)-methyltransferase 1